MSTPPSQSDLRADVFVLVDFALVFLLALHLLFFLLFVAGVFVLVGRDGVGNDWIRLHVERLGQFLAVDAQDDAIGAGGHRGGGDEAAPAASPSRNRALAFARWPRGRGLGLRD